MNVLCDRLNILGHWLPLLSHAWHVIPVSGNFISIVILDCVAKMETYARAAKHVAGYIIQIHPTPLLCICFPLLGCIDPQIRTSVKDISPLGSATVSMAFAAKISCDGSCKHKHHHRLDIAGIWSEEESGQNLSHRKLARCDFFGKLSRGGAQSSCISCLTCISASLSLSERLVRRPIGSDKFSNCAHKQAACCRGWVGGCLCASADCFKLASAGCQGLSLSQTGSSWLTLIFGRAWIH